MASNAVHRSRGERGAALIIAVGILTILLVIGATFFRIAQTELQVATNVTDQVRMDLMAEGATSVAIAFLRHDRINNPTATSLDHPWTTYFNGAWAAGKPWMWEGRSSITLRDGEDNDGDGEIDEDDEIFVDPETDTPIDNDGDGEIDEVGEGRDFVAGAIPVIRLRPDGTVPPHPPANANDIPDPPDYRFPRDAAKNVDTTRPLETNLGRLLYIPRVEATDPTAPLDPDDAGSQPTVPVFAASGPRYTMLDYGNAFDEPGVAVPDGVFTPADANTQFPWVVARNRAGGDFGVSPAFNDGDGDPTNDGAPALGLVEEQIAHWADVDNNGDGLNDSVWLPVSSIRVLDNDGIDNDLDGIVDEPGELGIFIYNAANDGLDNDGDGIIDNEHLDGLDNDGDGVDDNEDEPRIMFTTHFRSYLDRAGFDDDGDNAALITDGIDNDGDGLIDEPNEGIDEPFEGTLATINLTQADWEIAVPFIDWTVAPLPDPLTDVDVLDNDFTLVVNDRSDMARYLRRYEADGTYIDGPYPTLNALFDVPGGDEVQVFAEPVSDITGRMAVLITDVSSKVNINAVGGHSYRDLNDAGNDDTQFPDRTVAYDFNNRLRRSMGDGLTVTEYETRVLPDIGDGNARFLWLYRMGVPQGDYVWDVGVQVPDYLPELVGADFEPDITMPGYGYVDDDGNALWLSLNGLDDDGNGLPDDGLVPHNYAGLGDQLSDWLEGIDEPGEWQRFQPLRNTLAETDGLANTGIGDPDPFDGVNDATVNDFLGELGDTYFKTHESTKNIVSFVDIAGDLENEGITGERFGRIEPFITVHSNDRNIRFEHAFDQNILNEPHDRLVSGVRLDINVVDAERIRDELVKDFGYRETDPAEVVAGNVFDADAIAFAKGLKRGDMTVAAYGVDGRLLGQTIAGNAIDDDGDTVIDEPGEEPEKQLLLRHDPSLRAAQLAVNTQDFRDIDRVRAEISTFIEDDWWTAEGATDTRSIEYINAGIEAVRINELMIRPVRRIEAEMTTDLAIPERNPNAFSDAAGAPDDDFLPIYDPAPADGVVIGRQMADHVEAEATTPPTYNPEDIWQIVDETLIGVHSAFMAYEQEIVNPDFVDIVSTPGLPETFPNVIQFTFEASPQLPPGRYYLTMNSVMPIGPDLTPSDTDPSNDTLYVTAGDQRTLRATATTSSDILFATKYVAESDYGVGNELPLPSGARVTAGTTDIIEDVYDAVELDIDFHQTQIWQEMIVGYRDPGVIGSGRSGWTFLPTNLERVEDPLDLTTDVAVERVHGYFQDSGYTVEIPDPDVDLDGDTIPDLAANERPRLCVAFRHEIPDAFDDAPEPQLIAINFFDFSQEPDHEYIELVNVDPVNFIDIGGWAITVDGEVAPGSNDRRRIMTIPQDTTIAAGGSILLVANKQDVFASDPDATNLLETNGMGALRDSEVAEFFVTVPDAGVVGLDFDNDNIWAGTGIVDLIDNDGDGVIDGGVRPDDTIDSDNNNNEIDNDPETGDFTNIGDRIIELEIPDFNAVTDVQRLARIVLGGGMLPNYPERDGIDNDLDNRILVVDGVDNNMSGVADSPNEGIDEGFRLHYRGHGADTDQMPGAFGLAQPYRYNLGAGPDQTILADGRDYIGVTEDSPAFRAFQERRWYPGDNVVVTLYEDGGSAGGELSRVVDRVTYNEVDVINRSIDDLVDVDVDGGGQDRIPLDPGFPTFWPHDTMGVDFYKSLERKHPLYNGDRFGVSNRWQATDGAYDDWADRTGRLERIVDFDFDEVVGVALQSRINDSLFNHAFNGSPLRANLPHRLAENLNGQFGNNDISDGGTGTDETPRQWAFNRVDIVGNRSRPALRAPSQLMRAPHMLRTSAIESRAQADILIHIDSVNQRFDDDDTAPFTRQDRSIQQILIGQTFPAPDPTRESPVQTGGFEDAEVDALRNDLAALTSVFTAHTSQSMTAGQARVYPMWPFPLDVDLNGGGAAAQDGDGVPDGYRWTVPAGSGVTPPSGWSPVHLWELVSDAGHNMFVPDDPDNMRFASRYLMDTPASLQVDTDRWPLDIRTTIYASANLPAGAVDADPPDTFNAGTDHNDASGAEALFVWTGEDGLENGEYDVYVMLNEPISGLNTAHIDSGDDLLTDDELTTPGETDFGLRFMQTALADQTSATSRETVLPEDVIVDIDFFTDINGDRKVWNLPVANLTPGIPKPGSLNDGMDDDPLGVTPFDPNPTLWENFGLQAGVSPGPDGIYFYPITVTVKNNYLALFLRNRTPSGSMVRFSRIILAPRDRTPGKLNINTMMTRFGEHPANPGDPAYLNVLAGVPGLNRNFTGGVLQTASSGVRSAVLATDYPALAVDTTGQLGENLLGRVSKIALGRTDQVDGRYYNFLIDGAVLRPSAVAPQFMTFAEVEIQDPGTLDDEEPVFSSETDAELFEDQFDEVYERYTRTENLITTRSDVFEILVTVQTGTVTDRNGDGVLNYRDDYEFSITGERQMRTVYER